MPCTDLRVRELLKERSWTTKVLAEKTGMSESYLTHIKNGTRRWNEDSLKRISEAFEMEPISLLAGYKAQEDTDVSTNGLNFTKLDNKQFVGQLNSNVSSVSIKKIPMVGEIPSYPSDYNNKTLQITTGYKESFVPIIDLEGSDIFCLIVENQSMAPRFMKGDCLFIVPGVAVKTGDLVAVEYKTDKVYKQIMSISFSENLVVLESVNHKQSPIALVRNRNYCRIIGKVSYVYQKYS